MIKSPCPCKPILQEIFRNLFEIPTALVGRVILSLPMNRTPSSRPSPPVGEKVPEGRLRGIPTGSRPQLTSNFLEVFPSHEPCPLTPSLSPNGREGGRRSGEGVNPVSFSNASSRGPGAELRCVDARPTENANCTATNGCVSRRTEVSL